MDTAVSLVETYLRVNGYFTVTEFPIIKGFHHGEYRTVTDLDVLAVRFAGAGRLIPAEGRRSQKRILAADPRLCSDGDRTDMIIGEVKEGRAELNKAARDPLVLETVLTRFGCCTESVSIVRLNVMMNISSCEIPPSIICSAAS